MIHKYRVWDFENNKWFPQNEYLEITSTGKPFFNDYPILTKYDICFFTGLHDKNGKEIYEGDIVKAKGARGEGSGVIQYDSNRAMFILNVSMLVGNVKGFEDCNLDWEEFEVIGDIYTTPELLKGEEK